MTCSVHQSVLSKGNGVTVNGIAIARDVIAREVQHHPARTPVESLKAAAQALVVRELLLQEANRLGVIGEPLADGAGRRESTEEATLRALVEREVRTPKPDAEACRCYYERNRKLFRSPDIYEAAHILFPANGADSQAYARARAEADIALGTLREQPERFSEMAQLHSACSSAAQGGNLGQITEGQTTPEFEQVLFELAPGSITSEPVPTRYGFHIIRLDRKQRGCELPFEMVAERIAGYLQECVQRRALAQYIARLASVAKIEGVELPDTEAMRVN